MKNLAGLMKQAAQMQQKMQEMQELLESREIEGQAGAGMVIRVQLSITPLGPSGAPATLK